MKKITLYTSCLFIILIIFFTVFGSIIRQSFYISVTTVKLKPYTIEGIGKILRVVPHEAIYTDIYGKSYVWVLSESDDIGERYFYADKIFVEITAQDDIYTGIRGIQDGTVVILTSSSELKDKTRVKVEREGKNL